MGPFSIRDVKRNKTLELRRKHRHNGVGEGFVI